MHKRFFEQIIFAGTEIIEEFPAQRGRPGHRKSNSCAAWTGTITPRRPSCKSQLLGRVWNRARVASIGREAIILWGLTGRRSRRVRRLTIGRMAWLARRRRRRIHIDAFAINPGGGRGLRGGDAAAHDQRYQRERHCPHRNTHEMCRDCDDWFGGGIRRGPQSGCGQGSRIAGKQERSSSQVTLQLSPDLEVGGRLRPSREGRWRTPIRLRMLPP